MRLMNLYNIVQHHLIPPTARYRPPSSYATLKFALFRICYLVHHNDHFTDVKFWQIPTIIHLYVKYTIT